MKYSIVNPVESHVTNNYMKIDEKYDRSVSGVVENPSSSFTRGGYLQQRPTQSISNVPHTQSQMQNSAASSKGLNNQSY